MGETDAIKGNDEDDEDEDENIYWRNVCILLLTIMSVFQYFIEEVIPFFYLRIIVLSTVLVVISTFR